MNGQVSSTPAAPLDRLRSGIPGLDVLLGGGFLRSGVYMVHGVPGTGKTILANQICYTQAAAGGKAVYVTLLAESHARMLQHIRGLGFFDESVVPDRLGYISAFHDLETGGLKGLMDVLRREMRARQATVLILDGLVATAEAASSDGELKKFIHEIQTSAVFLSCTVFLLTSGTSQHVNAEHTMVDGLIQLEDRLYEARAERAIQIGKFRGTATLRGRHAFTISESGITVYPRIEAMYSQPQLGNEKARSLSTGVPTLDALIEARGVPEHSTTVVIGSSGTGKTTLGLHFISESSADQPGLWCGFFEPPGRLRAKARAIGLPIERLEQSGALKLMWNSQGEHVLDELGHQLLEEVDKRGVKRLVIDGLLGFLEAAINPDRTSRFFSCLTNELCRRGTTVLMTLETRDVNGSAVSAPYGISGFVDNLFFLRFVEERGEVVRLMSITKMRDTAFDVGIRAVRIGDAGMTFAERHTAGGSVIPTLASAPGS